LAEIFLRELREKHDVDDVPSEVRNEVSGGIPIEEFRTDPGIGACRSLLIEVRRVVVGHLDEQPPDVPNTSTAYRPEDPILGAAFFGSRRVGLRISRPTVQ
jgi:hypothetical protein